MIWVLGSLLGVAEPEVVPPEACLCDWRLPGNLQPVEAEGRVVYSDPRTALTVLVKLLPNEETYSYTKAAMLRASLSVIGAPIDTPLYYADVDGLEGVYYQRVVESEGHRVLVRGYIFDHPEGFVVLVVSAPEMDAADFGLLNAKTLASLRWRPGAPVPHMDIVQVTQIEEPLLEHHQEAPELTQSIHYPDPLDSPGRFSGFEQTRYDSAVGPLGAYWTPPQAGAPGPAVLFLQGGFGGPTKKATKRGRGAVDVSARAFSDAGLVVMVPSFRGESGNPGYCESFYGETQDVVDAVAALGARADVDPERIYLVGQGTGGTHVLNAAVAGASVRAVFSLGGRADVVDVAKDGGYGNETYKLSDHALSAIRSPNRWSAQLAVPTYYIQGEQAYNIDALSMAFHTPLMEAYLVPGADDVAFLTPVKAEIARQIVADTGPAPSFSFSEGLLYRLTR